MIFLILTVSGVTGRGQSTPQWLLTGKFLLTCLEKRGENWEEKEKRKKEGKLKKGRWKSYKMRREPFQNEEGTFFFCFSLFKTTKICFGSTKMEIFYRKKHFTLGEKNHEKWLRPLRKMFPLCPWWQFCSLKVLLSEK